MALALLMVKDPKRIIEMRIVQHFFIQHGGRSYLKIEIFDHNFNVNFYGVGQKQGWKNAGGDERKGASSLLG